MLKRLIVTVAILFIGVVAYSLTTIPSFCDEDVYSRFVTVEGSVKTVEPETGKEFIPAWQTLVFQRTDCKKCLIMIRADEDGKYKISLAEGKYRLIVKEDITRGGSYLDPKQPEIIDASNKISPTVFDIKLIRHKTPLDITIPTSSPTPSGDALQKLVSSTEVLRVPFAKRLS